MRMCEEREFSSFDQASIFYRHWPATNSGVRKAVVLLHRGHEHSGRVMHLVDELALDDADFFAWDARGNGRTPGVRGDAPGFDALVRDLDAFVAHIVTTHAIAIENIVVVAQSVGAVVAATWVHDYAPRIRGLVLASPAFKVKLYVPFARSALAVMQKLRGNFFVNSYVKPQWLTHDLERAASYRSDPLITRPISVRVLLGLYAAAERVVADAHAITVPVQLLISGSDFVVHRAPQDAFFDALSSPVKQRVLLPGFFHDTLGELERAPAIKQVRQFITARFDVPFAEISQRDAHRHGVTFEEAQRLARPLRRWSFRAIYWALVRAGLRLGGALSDGIALGLRTGFDSGSTLDYVYRNKAKGRLGLGKLIDRNYLDAIGWRGIRIRGAHLQEMLVDAARLLRGAGMPVCVLDVAAGHGRYVLESLGAGTDRADAIILRDYSELNVQQGQALIRGLSMEGVARFEQGDAFAPEQLATVKPTPTLAVVSGLYELFSDNDSVLRSLRGIASRVAPGGYLAYTGQPWHPQLEFIARALTSHRGGVAWVMRRRTQQEMDELVRLAGFEKVSQRIDAWGIFSVSLARRRNEI